MPKSASPAASNQSRCEASSAARVGGTPSAVPSAVANRRKSSSR